MAGGTLWRSVARAVGAAAPTVAVTANAAYCSACTAAPSASPRTRGAACSCKVIPGPVQTHPELTVVSYGPQQFWDIDDWEIAGDDEREHYVFGSPPTVKEVEEASSDLQNALRLGFFTPAAPISETFPKPESSSSRSPRSLRSPRTPLGPTIVDVTEVTDISTVTTVGDTEEEISSDLSKSQGEPEAWVEPPPYEMVSNPKKPEAPSSAMLEAFHQFQHDPQVQGMVVSLATDKGVWDAVLANEKIKEFRRNFSAPPSEDSLSGAMDRKGKGPRKNNVFSRLFWKSKQAFVNFVTNFQNFVTALFETVEKKGPENIANEKTNFFDRSVNACFILAVLVLAIVLIKRAVASKRG